MDPIPEDLAEQASSLRFPGPDDPGNPNSTFTLAAADVRKIALLIGGLVDYLEIEYAKCETKAP